MKVKIEEVYVWTNEGEIDFGIEMKKDSKFKSLKTEELFDLKDISGPGNYKTNIFNFMGESFMKYRYETLDTNSKFFKSFESKLEKRYKKHLNKKMKEKEGLERAESLKKELNKEKEL